MWPFIWPLKIGRAMHLSSVRVAGAAAKHKDVWFWPDLATCHYSNDSQAQMTAQDIQYITRDINPPNAPMIRPIEVYWAILKQKVYENNWSAKNRDQLIRKIKSCEKKIESSTHQNLFATLKTKMRRAVEGGLESLL